MIRLRPLLVLAIATTLCSLVIPPAGAVHNNQGTVKVHDNEDENPDVRNVPHVDCDFWIEGFMLGDDEGWIEFYAWPPTGDMELVETGEDQNWTADTGSVSGEFHFLAGPFTLESGHYRVEIFTTDGHPGSDSGHFAKAKTFWVECEEVVVNPPCPVILDVVADETDGNATVTLTWSPAAGAEAYVVYRATNDTDFDAIGVTDELTFVDDSVVLHVTYEYYVTAVIGNVESENCEIVEATAIPFFPSWGVGALAVLGSVGAFAMLRRRK